jgi:hypothetical protein
MVAVALLAPAAAADDREKATALIERASAASRLSEIKGAYTVKISFRIPGEHGTDGTYQYWSLPPSGWRMEIKARGYHDVEVGTAERRWVAADLPYTPEPIQTLIDLIRNGTAFSWPIATAEVRVKKESDGECVVAKRGKKDELHICFDAATSLLRSVSNSFGSRFEFSDYQATDGRMIPRKFVAYQFKYLVVDAKLDTLATLPTVDEALLQPPPNAEAWDWCENMAPAKMIRATRPQMPRGAPSGQNSFWVVIGTDGHVEQGGLISSAGGPLDRAAADAMKTWLFRPAMCNGMPIRSKTTATFSFDY